MESNSSEGSFGKALRRHGGEAGGEMALAFREHELGLSQRLADMQLNLRETIVDQGAAARQARWISAVTLAIVLGMTGGGAVLFKDIGRLEVKSDNLSASLLAISNRVDSLHAEMEQILDTIRVIDERTRDMANRAELDPAMIPENPEGTRPDSQLLVQPGNPNPEEAESTPGSQIADLQYTGELETLTSADARRFVQRITEEGFVARPVAMALSDSGFTYEQILQDNDFALQAISDTTVGRSMVTVDERRMPAELSRQICRIDENPEYLRFIRIVEDLGGEILCIDSLDRLLSEVLTSGIIVDIDLPETNSPPVRED